MTVHPKDIGVALMNGWETLDEAFETFDWGKSDPEFTGKSIFYWYDASHGFDDLRIQTDDGTFRVQITRISNNGE